MRLFVFCLLWMTVTACSQPVIEPRDHESGNEPRARPASDQPRGTSSEDSDEVRRLEARCCAWLSERKGSADACERLKAYGKAPRTIDLRPSLERLESPLAPGKVEASFWLNTGGDQMRCRPVQTGLGVMVRVAERQYRQQFASCDHAGHGSAIATPGSVDTAECDGRLYELELVEGAAVVRHRQEEIVRIEYR
jgi:hypothetical protein